MQIPDGMVLNIEDLSSNNHIDPADKSEIISAIQQHGKHDGPNLYEATPALQKVLVLDLIMSLYGLTNAGNDWNGKLNEVLTSELGFTRSKAEPCLYFQGTASDLLLLAVFVDDILPLSPEKRKIESFKEQLRKHFQTSDGNPEWLLGIRIQHDLQRGVTTLSQENYIEDLLRKFGLESMKPASIPDIASEHLEIPQAGEQPLSPDEKFVFQSFVGALLYLALCTRPDIASAVRSVAERSAEPTDRHLNAAKRVLRYIKGTKTNALTYTRGAQDRFIQGFVDASWTEDRSNRRSVTGFMQAAPSPGSLNSKPWSFSAHAKQNTWLSQWQSRKLCF
jgi:hypothetical protein